MASTASVSKTASIVKPNLSFLQIFNMSFGFFGIQFGWDLQRANMGPIYEYLKASPDQIPLLFLAKMGLRKEKIKPDRERAKGKSTHSPSNRNHILIGAAEGLARGAICNSNTDHLAIFAGIGAIKD